MKILLISNYFNHHQKPFCDELYQRMQMDFSFIATGVMSRERKNLGYGQDSIPAYVLDVHQDKEKLQRAIQMINAADIVIAGATPEILLSERLRKGKIVFRYTERPFKQKISLARRAYHTLRFKCRDLGDRNVYLLCAGVYAAEDFASMGMYRGRMLRWGYFPAVKEYDPAHLLAHKRNHTMLWCGRFLDWKHPDDAIKVARILRDNGYDFDLNIIGTGTMEAELRQLVEDYNLSGCVHFLGSMPPDQVRFYMEEAGVFLMTSDRQEGWGAVLNEAMNSACAVVAGDSIGSASFLIQNGVNGLVYSSTNTDELYDRVCSLLCDSAEQKRLGNSAYQTMLSLWNHRTAADRLLQLSDRLLAGETDLELFSDGPGSLIRT